jgi:hypothetical protein
VKWAALTALAASAAASLSLAACAGGSSSVPKAANPAASTTVRVSASAACLDLARWYETTNLTGSTLPATLHPGNLALLNRAVKESPSGTLYQDMSTVQSDVLTPGVDAQTQLEVLLTDTDTTESYCQSINPNQ